jgi:biopolymer transport protein ExbB
MRRSTSFVIRATALASIALGIFCSTAFAADTTPAAGKSLLEIIREGAEWPGIVIVILSLSSVTIIVEHFWTIRQSTMLPSSQIDATRQLIEARQFKECIDSIRTSRTMFADVLTVGLRHGRNGFEAMHEASQERAAAWASRLFRRVEYLNIIGNLAPLMGLLGTVLGMIRAFGAMQAAHGVYKPENLAGGISLALVNTFLGLAVAIISLGFFGICRSRVDAFTTAAQAAAIDLLENFRPITVGASTAIFNPKNEHHHPKKGEPAVTATAEAAPAGRSP